MTTVMMTFLTKVIFILPDFEERGGCSHPVTTVCIRMNMHIIHMQITQMISRNRLSLAVK